MARKDVIETEGKVVELLPHAMFLGELANGHRVEAYISGKMRLNFYSDLARRQSYVRDVPLRVDERPNNLPEKVRLSRRKTLPVEIETPVGTCPTKPWRSRIPSLNWVQFYGLRFFVL